MDLGTIIARNVKELRTERGLTQGELSRLSGISKAVLSDMEKGESNPTINTLWKIANGLHVPYTRLMEGIEKENAVVRREEPEVQRGEDGRYRIACYFPHTPSRNFEFFSVELDPDTAHATVGHAPKSQEYIYVMQGSLVVESGEDAYELDAGDALLLSPASAAHTYRNPGKETARFLVINAYGL